MNELFNRYIENNEKKIELDSSITNLDSREEFLIKLKARSEKLREMFDENEGIIKEIFASISVDNFEKLDPVLANELYEGVMAMYYADCDDFYILFKVLDALIGFYNKHKDYNKLINLFAVRYYQKTEVLDRLSKDVPIEDMLEDCAATLGYKIFYDKLDLDARRKIFNTYYNLCVVSQYNKKFSLENSFYYLQEMLAFWKSPMVQKIDKDTEEISKIVNRTVKEWLGESLTIKEADSSIQEFYKENSRKLFMESKAKGLRDCKIQYDIFCSYIMTNFLDGILTAEAGFNHLVQYYIERRDYLKQNHVENDKKLFDMSYDFLDYLYFYINVPFIVLRYIKENDISKDIYMPYVKLYLADLYEIWEELYANLHGSFLDTFVMTVCLEIISYESDKKVQKEWLSKFLVKRDLTTHIHSTMVAKLATTIGEEILNNKPEIFESIFMYSAREASENKDKLLDFIYNAAYFHDIGKTRIGDVINIQTRKIDDVEFGIIKKHPKEGADMAEGIKILGPYRDVILGHHKFYDGSAGYPEEFDNTKSPVRTVIDLVTICDCIDAATDIMGRNYARGKKCEKVIEEIYAERGTRYNPEIAEFIFNNKELQEKLRYLTEEGRIDCNYQIMSNYN